MMSIFFVQAPTTAKSEITTTPPAEAGAEKLKPKAVLEVESPVELPSDETPVTSVVDCSKSYDEDGTIVEYVVTIKRLQSFLFILISFKIIVIVVQSNVYLKSFNKTVKLCLDLNHDNMICEG